MIKRITVLLPRWEVNPPKQTIADGNVFNILIGAEDKLIVESLPVQVKDIRQRIIDFISNPQADPTYSSSPRKATASTFIQDQTRYTTYLHVYNEIKVAYHTPRKTAAQRQYGIAYEQLSKNQQANICADWPMVVSEAQSLTHIKAALLSLKKV